MMTGKDLIVIKNEGIQKINVDQLNKWPELG